MRRKHQSNLLTLKVEIRNLVSWWISQLHQGVSVSWDVMINMLNIMITPGGFQYTGVHCQVFSMLEAHWVGWLSKFMLGIPLVQ